MGNDEVVDQFPAEHDCAAFRAVGWLVRSCDRTLWPSIPKTDVAADELNDTRFIDDVLGHGDGSFEMGSVGTKGGSWSG